MEPLLELCQRRTARSRTVHKRTVHNRRVRGALVISCLFFGCDGVFGLVEVQDPNTATCSGGLGPRNDYLVGVAPFGLAAGDLDRDGVVDLVTADSEAKVTLLFGRGDGTFDDRVTLEVDSYPEQVAVGDLDSDGNGDVVVGYQGSLWVVPGNGDRTFSSPITTSIGTDIPVGLVIGDVDGVGTLDVVVAGRSPDEIRVMRGQGGGALALGSGQPLTGQPDAVVIADIDGDGLTDVVTNHWTYMNRATDGISVLRGTGGGGLTPAQDYPTGAGAGFVAVAQLDADALLDVAVSNYYDGSIEVLRNAGGGVLEPVALTRAGTNPNGIAAADIDGDGKLDLVVADANNAAVVVLFGDGSGGFPTSMTYEVGIGPVSLISADLNGDGKADIATTSYNNSAGNSVSVLLNCGSQ